MLQTRQSLIEVLATIQRSAAFRGQDIITFTAFLGDDEVRDYIGARFAMLTTAEKQSVLARAQSLASEG